MAFETQKRKRLGAKADLDKGKLVQEMSEAAAEPLGDPVPDQVPQEFANNSEERLTCVLIADTSGSMQGDPISEVNRGLKVFHEAVLKNAKLRRQLDICVVSYNDEPTVVPFVNAADWTPPVLTAAGSTRTAVAVGAALDQLEQRLAQYVAHGIPFHKPWVFLLSDGAATESPEETKVIAVRIQQAEADNKLKFFPVAVNSAAVKGYLASLSKVNTALLLKSVNFVLFFDWVLGSYKAKSFSQTTDSIELPNPFKGPANPSGWAEG